MLALVLAVALATYNPEAHIHALKPSLGRAQTHRLAHVVDVVARRHGVPPEVLVALMKHESDFDVHATHVNANGTTDWGLLQVNDVQVRRYGLNTCRLLNDPWYALDWGARILGDLKRKFEPDEPLTWFTRYNSSRPKNREKYGREVAKWFPQDVSVWSAESAEEVHLQRMLYEDLLQEEQRILVEKRKKMETRSGSGSTGPGRSDQTCLWMQYLRWSVPCCLPRL